MCNTCIMSLQHSQKCAVDSPTATEQCNYSDCKNIHSYWWTPRKALSDRYFLIAAFHCNQEPPYSKGFSTAPVAHDFSYTKEETQQRPSFSTKPSSISNLDVQIFSQMKHFIWLPNLTASKRNIVKNKCVWTWPLQPAVLSPSMLWYQQIPAEGAQLN